MKLIPLTNGGVTLVDDDFTDGWSEYYVGTDGYARNDEGRLLHRLIMDAPRGVLVDHINHIKLDNQRSNLRLCTNQENQRNRAIKPKKYKGVYKCGNKWQARITVDGQTLNLGAHDTDRLAALAYNEAALIHFTDFACLNEVENG